MLKNRHFPHWHFPMMNDVQRNRSLQRCIQNIDVSGKTVFEIGTGAGLVALYFARLGASHVVTCEQNEELYHLAQDNIKKAGYSDCITVLNKTSRQVIEDSELKFIPDIIFTETLDCGIVGEGFFAIAEDIKAIADEETIILPQAIFQFGNLVSSQRLLEQNSVINNDNLDMSSINQYQTEGYIPVWSERFEINYLTASFIAAEYNYIRDSKAFGHSQLIATSTGLCHGMLSYFHAQFGSQILHNCNGSSHWHKAFHPLKEPYLIEAGMEYDIYLDKRGLLTLKGEREYETKCFAANTN